jgi:hypothetical protein
MEERYYQERNIGVCGPCSFERPWNRAMTRFRPQSIQLENVLEMEHLETNHVNCSTQQSPSGEANVSSARQEFPPTRTARSV